MSRTASAPGKIILCGEYAVAFGFPGLALPSPKRMEVTLEEDPRSQAIAVHWPDIATNEPWKAYLARIIRLCGEYGAKKGGALHIRTTLPLGKGMGSSTALVIAVSRCLLGPDCLEQARAIEDSVNPGHSGLDFEVIWRNEGIRFMKGATPLPVPWAIDFLNNSLLIDTGTPNEQTPDLVAWVRSRKDIPAISSALETIGGCTDRLLDGEDPLAVIRSHHRAQVVLGVVPPAVQAIISKIELAGGAAKVIGAGSRTGGGGMVLALPAKTSPKQS